MNIFSAKLMDKNRVVIPNIIRAEFSLKKGDYLKVLISNQAIMLLPSRTPQDNNHVTLDSRGRITLPASAIDSAGIKRNTLLVVNPELRQIRLHPIEPDRQISYTVQLGADYRITIPPQALHLLKSPKKIFLTPIRNYPEILVSAANSAGFHCCHVRTNNRITIKSLCPILNIKPSDTITLTLNADTKLIRERVHDL